MIGLSGRALLKHGKGVQHLPEAPAEAFGALNGEVLRGDEAAVRGRNDGAFKALAILAAGCGGRIRQYFELNGAGGLLQAGGPQHVVPRRHGPGHLIRAVEIGGQDRLGVQIGELIDALLFGCWDDFHPDRALCQVGGDDDHFSAGDLQRTGQEECVLGGVLRGNGHPLRGAFAQSEF